MALSGSNSWVQRFLQAFLCACILGGSLRTAWSAEVGEAVSIKLRDGRIVAGALSGQTDGRHLRVFVKSSNVLLQSAFEWGAIEAAFVNGRPLTDDEAQHLIHS